MVNSKSNGSSEQAAAAAPASSSGRFRRLRRGNNPTVDADAANAEADVRRGSKQNNKGASTPRTDASTPSSSDGSSPRHHGGHGNQNGNKTPAGVRGRTDLRSPGAQKTPANAGTAAAAAAGQGDQDNSAPVPDFITQTDAYGNASTPRSPDAIGQARRLHPTGPEPHIHVTPDGKAVDDEGHVLQPRGAAAAHATGEEDGGASGGGIDVDPCDALLESLRMMCCCLVPEDSSAPGGGATKTSARGGAGGPTIPAAASSRSPGGRSQYSTRGNNGSQIVDAGDTGQVKLLPAHHPDDLGKKCLVLDLDETLVHSSFRAVPGADFVIPVQIEDVVHFVYVMKRPGVDEFLVEMAKYYEVVIYTASLNKYADPLLDLLDPHRTIRTRLFRESCVYYEGNYVKDLSLLDRDLSQAIIVDNSPSSYIFHPENAIDCTSFIDDPNDRELDQIGAFLKGIRNVDDVRGTSNLWRDWPSLPHVDGLMYDDDDDDDYGKL